jgi:hypothetical protein
LGPHSLTELEYLPAAVEIFDLRCMNCKCLM